MQDTHLIAGNRFIFFISRILILTGMVLVFAVLSSLFGYLLCKYLLGVDVSVVMNNLETPEQNPDGIFALKIFQLFASIGTFIIPALVFSKSLQQNPLEFLRIKNKAKTINYILAIGLILISAPAISWLYDLNKSISFPVSLQDFEIHIREMEESAQKITELFLYSASTGGLFFNFIIVALVPAITEEFFFRGCLQSFAQLCFRNPHISIAFTALVFSAFHGQFYGFFPRFMLGVGLGYVFYFSGSIWPSVFAHLFNNTMALMAAFFSAKYPETEFLKNEFTFPLVISIISLVSSVGLVYLMGLPKLNILPEENEQ